MKIINVEIEKLQEYINNPRNNDKAIDVVVRSIQEFGFKVPIVVDKNFVIVCGHTRYKAAKQIGMCEVPCIVASDLTEEQVNAFRLVDNKTSELAGWNYNALDQELKELLECNVDLTEFGFNCWDDADIDELFNEEKDTSDNKKEKEKKLIQCEHCGEWFEE